jgi:hypothetical protein
VRVVPAAAGPEAELARLARPSGPWLHLLDAAPADARQLGWLLGQDGVVVRQLRGHCGRTADGLFDEMGAALQLPGDPVEDWAGLAALLTDMAWLPGDGHVLVVTRASLLLAAAPVADLGGLVDAVREVARARAEEGDPVPFHVVLQDDAVGLAALRARLDAVRARYAPLAGWEASEPAAPSAPSARSALSGGPVDEVDLAAGTAVSTVDGVRSLGRAWESFRGGGGEAVRVYVPVLAGPVDVAAVAAAVAGAVAAAGAACVVVPVPADPALADPRQAAVSAAAVEVWPEPEVAAPEPEAAEPERVAEPEPVAEPVVEPEQVAEPEPEQVARPEPVAEPAVAAGPGPRQIVEPKTEPEPAVEEPVAPEPVAEGPHDVPGAGFELIAANLQWPFDVGSATDDAVDAALVRHASTSARTAGLHRTWVEDPAGGWVRVVLGYVNRTAIADVEAERTAIVDTLQRSGAARCCVEVLAASDASDAHRWLEQRCRPLWPTPQPPTEPQAAEPRAADPTAAEPTPPAEPRAIEPTPAEPPPATEPRAGEPQAADPLPDDAEFRPGPGATDPAVADLVAWAQRTEGVVGLVTAYTGDRLVVGAALAADADPERVRATAPAPVEPFAPARGLTPVHLRLTRGSTRVWTRRAERAAPEPARSGTLARPDAPKVTTLGPPPVRDTDEARGDEQVDGCTLVGIDRDTAVAKGDPDLDDIDTALAAWAAARPGAIALMRAVTEEGLRVYTVAVEETADPEGTRRAAAAAAAAAGLTRAAIEAFAPAGPISAFHLDLAVGSTRLWPRK